MNMLENFRKYFNFHEETRDLIFNRSLFEEHIKNHSFTEKVEKDGKIFTKFNTNDFWGLGEEKEDIMKKIIEFCYNTKLEEVDNFRETELAFSVLKEFLNLNDHITVEDLRNIDYIYVV